MFRMLVLQSLYNLSDEQVEYQVARPPVVHAVSAARHRGWHSGRHEALAISGDACEGRSDRETVRAFWPAFGSEGLHRSRRPEGWSHHRAGSQTAQKARRK